MTQINGGVVALGATLFLASAGTTWKAAHLRSDVVDRFRSKGELTQTGLQERAAISLRRLAGRVQEIDPDDGDFDPIKIVVDPATLQKDIEEARKFLNARTRLPRYFERMSKMGPILTVMLGLLSASILVALTYYSGWTRDRLVGQIALWVSVSLGCLIAIASIYYLILVQRFSYAETLSVEVGNGD